MTLLTRVLKPAGFVAVHVRNFVCGARAESVLRLKDGAPVSTRGLVATAVISTVHRNDLSFIWWGGSRVMRSERCSVKVKGTMEAYRRTNGPASPHRQRGELSKEPLRLEEHTATTDGAVTVLLSTDSLVDR